MYIPLRVLRGFGVLILAALMVAFELACAQESGEANTRAEKVQRANGECFACHSETGLKNPPKESLDLKRLRGLIQHPETFYQSDHQKLLCTKCHNEGYEEHPHAESAKDSTSTCTDCHAKKAKVIEPQFEKSVHAKNLGDAFTCTSCHDPHLMRLAEKQNDPARIVAQDNRVCLGCHDSDDQFARLAPEKKQRPLLDDIHSWLPNARLHWRSVRCVECHTPEVAAGEMLSHEVLARDRAQRECVACHRTSSTLRTRLYRHLVKEEEQRFGFSNSVILATSYVVGATRNALLDTLVLGAFVAMLFGLLVHGLGRIFTRGRHRPEQAAAVQSDGRNCAAHVDNGDSHG